MTVRVAILITSHNRRDVTQGCLDALERELQPFHGMCRAYLVDDGSTDGTAEMADQYDFVRVQRGPGWLYWTGGMREAYRIAVEDDAYDAFLLLNDDVRLFEGAFRRTVELHQYLPTDILIGSTTTTSDSDEMSYGGRVRSSPMRPLLLKLSPIGSRHVDTFNGNFVLIPAQVIETFGFLDGQFTHRMADNDYGFRLSANGVGMSVLPFPVGTCRRGSKRLTDWSEVVGPKGWPPSEYFEYCRRHGGFLGAVSFLLPYLKFIARGEVSA